MTGQRTRPDPPMSGETEDERADRVWGPGGWERHLCSVNGSTRLVTHSAEYHRR